MNNRKQLSQAFLDAHGWGRADRVFLAGDASNRTYDRLTLGQRRAVLMDAPPNLGEDVGIFIATAGYLHGAGLSVPNILAKDTAQGFLVLEDFGDDVFARVVKASPGDELPLYTTATDALICLQSAQVPPDLPALSTDDWARAALFVLDWYAFGVTGERGGSTALLQVLRDTLDQHANQPPVLIHRDYHAENLIWLSERKGLRRAGILDFQLLQSGQPVYDLVSLLQDARRDVSSATVEHIKRYYCDASGNAGAAFDRAYATLGVQRALRIIGIFARLSLEAGRPQYLQLIPRVWAHLQQNLTQVGLEPLQAICQQILPPPTPHNLTVLSEKCARRQKP